VDLWSKVAVLGIVGDLDTKRATRPRVCARMLILSLELLVKLESGSSRLCVCTSIAVMDATIRERISIIAIQFIKGLHCILETSINILDVITIPNVR